jgi:hypothetical protein
MAIPRVEHRTTLLADGRVLATGGQSPASGNGGYDTHLAELYDPGTNTWSTTGSTASGRVGHTATRLLDGKVLVAGGINGNICTNDVTTELYDPATGAWSPSGNLPFATYGHTATRLTDGRVLLAGGGNRCGGVFAAAVLYNPVTGTWSPTGSMTTGREWHSAVRLSDGRVLVAGGEGPNPFPALSSAEIYDPVTGTWTATGSMTTTRCGCSAEFLTLLADGRVLAAAGYSGNANNLVPNGPQAEIYDPITGGWTPTGSMSVGRSSGTFHLLNDGTVLAAGGYDGTFHASAALWDPGTGTWSITASLATARASHVGSVLANGNVLVAGGGNSSGCFPCLSSAELYSPAAVPATLTLSPPTDSNPVGTSHTVTATVDDATGQPVEDVIVRFTVTGSVSASGQCTTGPNGQCTFTYQGPQLPGGDAISAYADSDGDNTQDAGEPTGAATKTWVLPPSTPLCEVTISDGGRITAANGDRATFGGHAEVPESGDPDGHQTYQDHGPAERMTVDSISVLAVVCSPDRTQADIYGLARIDGSGSFDYRIQVNDNGEPGRGVDKYWILLSSGYNSGLQTLEAGNVQITVHE